MTFDEAFEAAVPQRQASTGQPVRFIYQRSERDRGINVTWCLTDTLDPELKKLSLEWREANGGPPPGDDWEPVEYWQDIEPMTVDVAC